MVRMEMEYRVAKPTFRKEPVAIFGLGVEIVEETVKAHAPGAIIFADECFADDNELTNAGLALDKAQIEFRWI